MLIATHFTFVFMVPIMLLNFLIGLMSTKVAEHMKNRDLGICLSQVAAASNIEARLRKVARVFYRWYRQQKETYNTIIYKTQNKCQMWADANQLSMTAYL